MYVIDANIFLEFLLQQDKATICENFLKKVEEGRIKATISLFTIHSIIIVLERYGKEQDRTTFLSTLTKIRGLTIYENTFQDTVKAVKLMQKYKLDFEDSLTLQTYFSCNCSAMVSFDSDFNKVKDINRKTPEQIS